MVKLFTDCAPNHICSILAPKQKKKRVNERPVNLSTVLDCHDGRKNAENKPILCLTAKTDRLDWTVKDLTSLPRKTCQRYGIFLWTLIRFSNGSISTAELLRSSNLVLSPHVAIVYYSDIYIWEKTAWSKGHVLKVQVVGVVRRGRGLLEITKANIPISVSYSLSQIKAKTRLRGMNLWSETSFEVLAVLSKNCLTMSNLKTFYVRSEESALAGGEREREKGNEIFPLSIFRSLLCQLIY